MKIEVLYIDGCPNYRPAIDRLKAALQQEGLSTRISVIKVKDKADAKALKFWGPPTIRIHGIDIDFSARTFEGTGIACRYYSGGLPTEEMIRAALKEARER